MSSEKKHLLNEPEAGFEKAELDLLREGLKRTHKERFLFLMRLVKIQNTMNKAKITYKPFPKA